jgi:prepilin-type processing-associated H-X9-DG protein
MHRVISYGFNGANVETNRTTGLALLGIAGQKLHTIVEPAKTVLVAEHTAFGGGSSMHDPPKSAGPVKDQRNQMSFVDGHVSYLKIFYINEFGAQACFYDPPAGYDYKWSGL